MHRWKIILTLALLACWSLATFHCKLERTLDLQFLSCGAGETDEHDDDACQTDSCAQVESSLFKSASSRIETAAPVLLIAFLPTLPPETKPLNLSGSSGVRELRSLELPVTWQFSRRTASPPRAPSIVS